MENKIMAVDKRIQGIRVYVDGKSREIQKKLFELGAEWAGLGKKIDDDGDPFLYVRSNGLITSGENMMLFKNGGYNGDCHTEVKADELLSWEPEPQLEPQLEPFQKVLVRQEDGDEWEAGFFSHYRQMPLGRKPHHVCVTFTWKQCIPYEGNEHLLGTTDKPNKK